MEKKLRVGVIGCGSISDQYFNGCRRYRILELAGCADIDEGRARAKGAQYGIPGMSVAELLNDPGVDLVINLTLPRTHAEVNLAALNAGKHVYCEKPFALSHVEGRAVLALAKRRRRRVGCAPDTFLGGGLQTVRKLLDDGRIGKPVTALAFLLMAGHERWHPSPEFYYKAGGGPMFDMGPYYLTALANLFGPAQRVCGSALTTFPERLITSQPLAGKKIAVETPTHLTGIVEYANGAVANLIMSFDVPVKPDLPLFTLVGTEGVIQMPDPNTFQGPVRMKRRGEEAFVKVPLTHTDDRGRGTAVADMAYAIFNDRPARASGALANHVVEIMEAFEKSAVEGRYVTLKTEAERPAALPSGLAPDALDP